MGTQRLASDAGQPQDVIHYPVSWCHGAAGIGQMRAAVSPLGIGDPAATDHALEATTSEGSAIILL